MTDISQRRSRQRTWLVVVGASALSSLLLATPAFAGEVNLSGLSSEPTVQRFIVKYRDGSAERAAPASLQRALASAAAAVPARSGRALGLTSLRRLAIGPEVVKADRALDRAEAETLMRRLAADPNVEYVEVDQRMTATLTPNDPSLSSQWAFGTSTAGINVRPAWDQATGTGVVVAVIDTGITNHADLNANILPGYDFISDTFVSRDGDGRDANPADEGDWNPVANECYSGSPVTNSSWHGTHVAGTVAAQTNNSVGVAGTAFGAKVLPVRVLGRCGGYTSDIADAIVWASGGTVSGVPANTTPAEVINMSLGGGGTCSTTYQNAINGAVGRGTTVVVAAGNSAANVSGSVPANCANVIAVAATTSSRAKASYSNYGTGIDISAPGSSILSTLNSGTTTPGSASYASYNGTSMAAPHVAGVVALMQSVAPSPLTPAQVETTIKNTAASFSCSQGCGAGLLDANAAVTAALGGGGPGPGPGNQLQDGVPVTGLGASTGAELNYTVAVPSGASSLSVTIAGGSGDADLYVRLGSAPTDTTYGCRPYLNGNNETCTFNAPSAGTYYVRVKAYSTFSGVTLTANY
ncbi:S8 family serine peptidase [Xanthomonas sp. AM6]|uniref:S8 family peptidase n=1 Tax=Xanthomonas sp. AM6 TaxID=2982531 RepID=UPI0021D9FDCE|nr:S8 family peptidase [Xanthomonas sp. AM6]UYB51504.1 S8 family serine peptidase [Xanthomonas sp. AM6]